MRTPTRAAAALACAVIVTACSSNATTAPPARSKTSSPASSSASTASAPAVTAPAPATSGLSDKGAATVFLRTNRPTILAFISAAGAMRVDVRAGVTGAASCTRMKTATLAVTTVAPAIDESYGYVPALAALADAATKYFAASSACAGGLPLARFRDDFRAGEALLKAMRVEARQLGVRF